MAASGDIILPRGTPCWSTTASRTVRSPSSRIRAATSSRSYGRSAPGQPVPVHEPRLPYAGYPARDIGAHPQLSPRCGGSPNAGKIRSVSRKNVIRLIRPPDTSCTCSAQGSCPPAGSGLYWANA